MGQVRRSGDLFTISITPDGEGYVGRECPQPDCGGYFKIVLGTGLKGTSHCYCPYCGFNDAPLRFTTKEQMEYAKSVALNAIWPDIMGKLKAMEFDHPPQGPFGIGLSLRVNEAPAPAIQHYFERELETRLTCDKCTLRYAVYGVFAHCPDCGVHNTKQILDRNLDLAEKLLMLAESAEPAMAGLLVANALEEAVSVFDAFGRELCLVHAAQASNPSQAAKLSFQRLAGAQQNVQTLFGVDMSAAVTSDMWQAALKAFQKRHLFAHRMGVVDAEYIQKSGDRQAVIGRKITVTPDEVCTLVNILRDLGSYLNEHIAPQSPGVAPSLPSTGPQPDTSNPDVLPSAPGEGAELGDT